jgi:hypothetical protein
MKRTLTAVTAWAAVMCLVAVGCGSMGAPGQAGRQSGADVGSMHPAPPTEAGNRSLARSAARRMLALAPVPPHARRLRSAPRALSALAMGTPGRLAAWGSAQLDVAIAPDGTGASVLRADGVAEWLDPVPIRDSAVGKRLHVQLAAGCPDSDAGVVGVRNPGQGLTGSLLPSRTPDAALRCAYYGGNVRPFRLRAQQRLDAARARVLAASILATPISHPLGARYMCPMDDGSADLIGFAYPGQPNVDVWVRTDGCGGTFNGYIEGGSTLP